MPVASAILLVLRRAQQVSSNIAVSLIGSGINCAGLYR